MTRDPNRKLVSVQLHAAEAEAFRLACRADGQTMSRVLRAFITSYVAQVDQAATTAAGRDRA